MTNLLTKIHKSDKGFTLMEMLLVIGLIGMVGAMTIFIDINSYRGSAFRAEMDSLGTALQSARANSFNNINQKRHGVAIQPGGYDGYVIFEGDSYATRDTAKDLPIKSSYEITFGVNPTEIAFDQLSGNANYSGDITVTDPQRGMSLTININNEGKIAW